MLYYEKRFSSNSWDWVVFIHGAGGNSKTWKYQIDEFSEYFNVLSVDLRDHGASKQITPHHENYTFNIISSDIKQILDKESITSAYFVTLSFGSVLLQHFAMMYPQTIQKAIFAGGIFKGNLAIRSFVHFARLLNLILPYSKMYSLFSFLLMPKKRNQKARRLYQMQARKLTQKEYLKWVGLYGEFFRLLKSFFYQELNFPSKVIMGGDDYIFLKAAKAFSAYQAYTSLSVIPATGHICNIESPKNFNKLAIEFLLEPIKALPGTQHAYNKN